MVKSYQIDISYACFRIDTDNNICIDAAPIAKWMIGKTVDDITAWVFKKNGKIIELRDL